MTQTQPQKPAKPSSSLSVKSRLGSWPSSVSWTKNLSLGSTLPLILLLEGCGMFGTVTPPPSRELALCYVPTKELQPNPLPPLSDKLNRDLLQEADDLRDALTQCNREKADALKSLIKQNELRKASSPDSKLSTNRE